MAAPSQLQRGLAAGITGLFGGMSKGREEELGAQQKEAYLKSMMDKQAMADAAKAKREEEAAGARFERESRPTSDFRPEFYEKYLAPGADPNRRYPTSTWNAMMMAEAGQQRAATPRPSSPKPFDIEGNTPKAQAVRINAAKMAGAMDDDPKTWSQEQAAAGDAAEKKYWADAATIHNRALPRGFEKLRVDPNTLGGTIQVQPEAEIPGSGWFGTNIMNTVEPEKRTFMPNTGPVFGKAKPQVDTAGNTAPVGKSGKKLW